MVALDCQVGASGDDGYWTDSPSSFASNAASNYLGRNSVNGGGHFATFLRWPSVTIPVGARIQAAYISVYYYSKTGTPPACVMRFEKAASPVAVSSAADGNSRGLTTNSVGITGPSSGTWMNSEDISAIIQELVDSYSYAAGAAMQCVIKNFDTLDSTSQRSLVYAYDQTGNVLGPKLHIEYTVGPAIPILGQQYRRR